MICVKKLPAFVVGERPRNAPTRDLEKEIRVERPDSDLPGALSGEHPIVRAEHDRTNVRLTSP